MKLFHLLLLLISIILSFLQPFEGLGDSVPRSNKAAATLPSPLIGNNGNSDVISIDKKHHLHPHPPKKVMINCGVECKRRCKETSRKKVCLRACKACCQRCHCVPPGTYGHKRVCPCYAKLKTHGGKPKCP